jgi:hypothetical protein
MQIIAAFMRNSLVVFEEEISRVLDPGLFLEENS